MLYDTDTKKTVKDAKSVKISFLLLSYHVIYDLHDFLVLIQGS